MSSGVTEGSTEERRSGAPPPSFAAPAVSLPNGGGSIRGIGEKFTANAVTGTGSTSLPVATSRARAGVQPELSLTSDSGHGNGPFGFGWSLLTAVTPRSRFAMPLSLPSITPKTDKGQPGYDDAAQTHVSLLSGSEDLVPAFSARVALSLEGAHVRVGPLD